MPFMNKLGMVIDAFRPTWGWQARLRAADPADRWKFYVFRIGAGIIVAILVCLLGVRLQRLQ
jgi:hypothetical protein